MGLSRLSLFPLRLSLFPKFRGASPVPRALEAGVDVTGVTVLFTVFEMDAGPIVGQTEVPVPRVPGIARARGARALQTTV